MYLESHKSSRIKAQFVSEISCYIPLERFLKEQTIGAKFSILSSFMTSYWKKHSIKIQI
jgi:hypothetical protein